MHALQKAGGHGLLGNVLLSGCPPLTWQSHPEYMLATSHVGLSVSQLDCAHQNRVNAFLQKLLKKSQYAGLLLQMLFPLPSVC